MAVFWTATPPGVGDEPVMSTRTTTAGLAGLALLAAVWWFLAPSPLGGRASYVVTHGVSMQPRFHTGDLAIVYPSTRYRIGDVAAYRSDVLGTTVLHRVIGVTPDGHRFKGDNNTWTDPETPKNQQIVGRLVIRVPHGGVALGWLHQPPIAALLATVLLLVGTAGAGHHRRRRRRRTHTEGARMSLPNLRPTRRPPGTSTVVAGTSAMLFAVLAVAAVLVPGDSRYVEHVPWTTTVTYDYTADVSPNLIYPDGQVRAGQTVFRRLADRLVVNATWSLKTGTRHQVEGVAGLDAVVQGPAGWTHSFELAPPRPFRGDRLALSGTLDLPALDDVVARAGRLTGIPTERYTVLVRPTVRVDGTIAGTTLTAGGGPQPALALGVTPGTVSPAAADPTTASPAGTDDRAPGTGQVSPSGNGLAPAATTHSTAAFRTGPATWALVGHRLPVAPLRWIGALGAALSLLAVVLLLLLAPAEKDPCTRQLRRHRAPIVSISGLHVAAASNIVELTSIDALVEVARRYDRLILHQADPTGLYLVEDETGLYRFQCPHRRDHAGKRQHLAGRPMRSDVATRSA